MDIQEIRRYSTQINKIAKKYGIKKIYVFGSVARGDDQLLSDVDFLVDLNHDSLFGIAGFGYDVGRLLGIMVDVIPFSMLPHIEDQDFTNRIQREAIPL